MAMFLQSFLCVAERNACSVRQAASERGVVRLVAPLFFTPRPRLVSRVHTVDGRRNRVPSSAQVNGLLRLDCANTQRTTYPVQNRPKQTDLPLLPPLQLTVLKHRF